MHLAEINECKRKWIFMIWSVTSQWTDFISDVTMDRFYQWRHNGQTTGFASVVSGKSCMARTQLEARLRKFGGTNRGAILEANFEARNGRHEFGGTNLKAQIIGAILKVRIRRHKLGGCELILPCIYSIAIWQHILLSLNTRPEGGYLAEGNYLPPAVSRSADQQITEGDQQITDQQIVSRSQKKVSDLVHVIATRNATIYNYILYN